MFDRIVFNRDSQSFQIGVKDSFIDKGRVANSIT
jgi:hypothetical protein